MVIAHLVQSLGIGWDEAGWKWDVPRLMAMNKYWAAHPPVHVLVASYIGYIGYSGKDDSAAKTIPKTRKQMAEMNSAMSSDAIKRLMSELPESKRGN